MNDFITDRAPYLQAWQSLNELVVVDASLPNQVFQENYRNFSFISFDDIFSEPFYEKMSFFARLLNETSFTMFVIKPDPESYFYRHFGKYPVIKMSNFATSGEFMKLVFEDPGGSSADAIAYNSTNLLIYPDSLRWGIYGSRDFEVGIFAGINQPMSEMFAQTYKSTFDVSAAIETFVEPAWGSSCLPDVCRNGLTQNYSVT
jgi:hypothetical protein